MQKRATQAVSVALVAAGRVLLVKRGRAPAKDLFAFPGGKVETGETLEQAARRELLEETGLTAGALKQVAVLDIQPEEGHGVAYELHVFGATDPDGVLAPADDAAAAGWFSLEEMLELRLTDSTEEITRELLEGARDA